MNIYHIWCNLKPETKDLEFAEAVSTYLSRLEQEGRVHAWRLSRRKLGLGHQNLREFHVTIDFESMTQMDAAFDAVSSRANPVEGLHHAVNSKVTDTFFALYRDFPDAGRIRGEEEF
jgi:hypothetical protein